MTTRRRPPDARLAAARYAVEHAAPPEEQAPGEETDPGRPTLDQHGQMVEIAIQQAMRRGDFEDLPGRGKPIEGLDRVHDPDWWIRRKIEREGLTGLGPPALLLRNEDAALRERLDGLHTESAVREALVDFNRRVREARLQLLGGPPVLVAYRDVEAEVAAWHERARERREARRREDDAEREREAAALAAMSWRERRRAKRRREPRRL
ncbi:DUF1992 domain-containing protein [Amnibacterium sp. CER49]|uniref:DnaJ family domain-containing protein n=1 Tax=Amnibacterium sp. CER49 TaxID=3039161 RepID=UPI00244A4858|nr:DUF1992 domain-containing protein [Amnibacterium sp. CER49]MDH2444050.1 DUF1992 domain-containing protein [Amnibacterium sp. CER49]